jgi:hypothetical protein
MPSRSLAAPICRPGVVASRGSAYAGAGSVLRCAADEAWWAVPESNRRPVVEADKVFEWTDTRF